MTTLFYFAAVGVALNLFQFQLVRGYASQTCGTTRFYCPYGDSQTDQCLSRNQRCLGDGTSACAPDTGEEPNCNPGSAMGTFKIWVFRADISSSSSSSRKRAIDLEPEHQGVNYRGFDYEFGKSYQNGQELDTLDPQYKYRNGRDGYRLKRMMGTSRCGREQAFNFMTEWAREHEYAAFGRFPLTNYANCQTFTHRFVDFLRYECGRTKRSDPAPSCNCTTCKDYYLLSGSSRLSPMAIPITVLLPLVLKLVLV